MTNESVLQKTKRLPFGFVMAYGQRYDLPANSPGDVCLSFLYNDDAYNQRTGATALIGRHGIAISRLPI